MIAVAQRMSPRTFNVYGFQILAVLLAACGTETRSAPQQVDLPEQLIVNIDSQGSMYILAEDTGERLNEAESRKKAVAFLHENPGSTILVTADSGAPYEAVVRVIEWLGENGATSIGIPMRAVP
jgi:biopolymer transport protein ExbD